MWTRPEQGNHLVEDIELKIVIVIQIRREQEHNHFVDRTSQPTFVEACTRLICVHEGKGSGEGKVRKELWQIAETSRPASKI